MIKNNINKLELSLVSFFLIKSFIFMGGSKLIYNISLENTIFCLIIGTFISFILIHIYYEVFNYKSDFNLFQKIDKLFTKIPRLLLKIIFIIGLSTILISFLKSYMGYIVFNFLPNFTPFIILLSIIMVTTFIAKRKTSGIFRSSEIMAIIFLMLFIIFISGLIPIVEPNNLKPFTDYNVIKILKGSFLYSILSATPLFLLSSASFEENFFHHKKKYLFRTYLITSIIIIIIFIITLGVLGLDLSLIYKYPETLILKKITFLDFIERIENILGIMFLIDGIYFISIIFVFVDSFLKNIIKKTKISNYLFYGYLLIILFITNLLTINIKYIIYVLIITLIILPIILFFKIKKDTKVSLGK